MLVLLASELRYIERLYRWLAAFENGRKYQMDDPMTLIDFRVNFNSYPSRAAEFFPV